MKTWSSVAVAGRVARLTRHAQRFIGGLEVNQYLRAFEEGQFQGFGHRGRTNDWKRWDA